MTFVIPGEPVPKGRPKFGNGRTYTPAKTVRGEKAVALAAQAAGVSLLTGPVGLDVVAMYAFPASWSQRRRAVALEALHLGRFTLKDTRSDFDNILKLVADGLNGIAYRDDGQVAEVRFCKAWGPVAETHVRLWQVDAPEWPEAWWTDAARVRREVA